MSEEVIALPAGWASVKLSDICEKIGDVDHRMPKAEADGIPYVSTEDFSDNNAIDYDNAKRITRSDFESLCRKIRPEYDDLLLSRYGTIGEVRVVRTHRDFQASYAIAIIKPVDRSLTEYLSRVLTSPSVTKQIQKYIRATAQPNLGLTHIRDFQIPVPPEAEQRRIVAKIEALQERSQKAREALAEVGPLLEQFRQSLLAAAFRGDLTADWRAANPNVEPASELLNRIRQERRQKWEQGELAKYEAKGRQPPKAWQNNYQEPGPIDDSEFPSLPKGWCWCRLGMLGTDPISTVQTGPFGAQLHTEEFVESGVPVIAVGNLTGVGFTKKHLYFITHEKAQQLSRYDVHAGDLLFARSGATLGKVCVAPDFVSDWRMTGHILRARLNINFVLPDIAVYALWGDSTVKKIVNEGVRGMTRPGYNTSLLNAIPIPLPPISEQRQMLTVIEEAFDGTERLIAYKAYLATDLTQLDQSVLAKAFRGELVPQDPNDEPASVLLERIRESQRNQSKSIKKKTRTGKAQTNA